MESFLAQSPPAWNDPGPPLLDGEAHSDEETDDDDDEDDIPNSNFALLDSSLPGYAEGAFSPQLSNPAQDLTSFLFFLPARQMARTPPQSTSPRTPLLRTLP